MPRLFTTGSMRTLLPQVFYRNPLPSSVHDQSRDPRYIEVNDAWLKFFGRQREEVLGRTLHEIQIWASAGQRQRHGELLRHHPRMRDSDGLVRRGDGSEAEVLVSWEHFEHAGRHCMLSVFVDITERVQAERALRASEVRFQKIVETSPLPISLTRLDDGVYLNVNRAFEHFTGYARADLLGRSSLDLHIWADPSVRDEIKRQFSAGSAVARLETRARTRDGRLIEISFSATVIDLDGVPALHGTVFDLTPIREAVQIRQSVEARMGTVLGIVPNALSFARASDGGGMTVNRAWYAMFGYTAGDIEGQFSPDLKLWVDPQFRQRRVAMLERGEPVRNVETRFRTKSGRLHDALVSSELTEIDGVRYLVTSVTDISEARRAERLRHESDDRFQKIFRTSPDPIVITAMADGAYIEINDAWTQQFGYRREEVLGRTSRSLGVWVEVADRDAFVAALAQHGSLRNYEARLRRRSGEVADVLMSADKLDLDGNACAIVCITDVTERKNADRRIHYLATRDYLTGLPNRLLFSERLHQALAQANRGDTRLALLFIDLDHFKNINDSLGHQAGDYLLTEVAARLTAAVRGADTVGRQGGDEFLVLLEGLVQGRDAAAVAEKLVATLSEPVTYKGQLLNLSCSIGISIYPDDAGDEGDLLRNADLAMYAAKDAGRHGFRFFTAGMNVRLVARLALEAQLRGAMGRDEFVLHLQPKVAFNSNKVTGCEALLRWNQPGAGIQLPGRFIHAAEETRLILPIGAWVLRETCRLIRRWLDAGLKAVPVACNLSVHQFTPDLPEQVASALRETGVPAHLLELEITETVMMSDAAPHLNSMRELKQLGVQLALDDFGTGYSSLSYLRDMDLDVLKIDRSFVRDVAFNTDAQAIVSAIIAMAGKFSMKTVAEGVESEEQANVLRSMQCDEYQGFLFSPALPANEFEVRYLNGA